MTYGRDTVTMRDRFQKLLDDKAELKKDFEEYITWPAHSLELRWQMFLDAPKELSNHERWLYHGFDHILAPGAGHMNWIDDILWTERHGVIDLVDIVNEEFSKPDDYEICYDSVHEEGFLDKIKEQILKDNIKSFTYDW